MHSATKTRKRLDKLVDVISQSGNPDEDFWYLGGPMTGIPKFNFPRFTVVASKLRASGLNIVTPHELDDPDTEAAALASVDGAPGSGSANGEKWEDFLSRDVVIVSLPTCQGGIFMEGWHRSSGANLESYILDRLKKSVKEYDDGAGLMEDFILTDIDRDSRIQELNDIDDITKAIRESDPFGDRA
jgi:hypothetical protein